MFEKHRRISICRAINVCFLVLGAILIWVDKPFTPLHYVSKVIMIPTSLNLCVVDESKGWSILWLIIAIVALVALLVEFIFIY